MTLNYSRLKNYGSEFHETRQSNERARKSSASSSSSSSVAFANTHIRQFPSPFSLSPNKHPTTLLPAEKREKGCWGGAGMRGEFPRRKCQNKGFVEASFERGKKNFRPPPFGVNHFGTQEDRRRLRRPPTATQII